MAHLASHPPVIHELLRGARKKFAEIRAKIYFVISFILLNPSQTIFLLNNLLVSVSDRTV